MSTETDLDDATDTGTEGAYAANAGEFAARWNALTKERREAAVASIMRTSQEASACFQRDHEGRIEWLERRITEGSAQVAELQAVNAAVRDHVKRWSPTRFKRLFALLSTVPSDVLAAHDAEISDNWRSLHRIHQETEAELMEAIHHHGERIKASEARVAELQAEIAAARVQLGFSSDKQWARIVAAGARGSGTPTKEGN